jgi:hypothetical protein
MTLATGYFNAILEIVRLARKNHKRKQRYNIQNNSIWLDDTLHKKVSLSIQCSIFIATLRVAMLSNLTLNVVMLTIAIMSVAASSFLYSRVSDK